MGRGLFDFILYIAGSIIMKPGFYKTYCLVIVGVCTLINLFSGGSGSSGSSARGWSSGSSSGSNWGGGGGGHK